MSRILFPILTQPITPIILYATVQLLNQYYPILQEITLNNYCFRSVSVYENNKRTTLNSLNELPLLSKLKGETIFDYQRKLIDKIPMKKEKMKQNCQKKYPLNFLTTKEKDGSNIIVEDVISIEQQNIEQKYKIFKKKLNEEYTQYVFFISKMVILLTKTIKYISDLIDLMQKFLKQKEKEHMLYETKESIAVILHHFYIKNQYNKTEQVFHPFLDNNKFIPKSAKITLSEVIETIKDILQLKSLNINKDKIKENINALYENNETNLKLQAFKFRYYDIYDQIEYFKLLKNKHEDLRNQLVGKTGQEGIFGLDKVFKNITNEQSNNDVNLNKTLVLNCNPRYLSTLNNFCLIWAAIDKSMEEAKESPFIFIEALKKYKTLDQVQGNTWVYGKHLNIEKTFDTKNIEAYASKEIQKILGEFVVEKPHRFVSDTSFGSKSNVKSKKRTLKKQSNSTFKSKKRTLKKQSNSTFKSKNKKII